MRSTWRSATLAALFLSIGIGGVSAQEASRYTINRVSLQESATGNNESTRGVNRNTKPSAIARTIRANPGLAEALERNNIDPQSIGAIRVRPDKIVDVFDNGERSAR